MARKLSNIWITAITALLAACSNTPVQPPPNTGKYAPEVNPKPKYFLTVKGNIDPQLKDSVPLKIITTYYTTNPECKYVINSLEGVSTYRQIDKIITVKADVSGDFKYNIPLDLYNLGYCGWKIINITYINNDKTLNYEGYNIASFFNPENSPAKYVIGTDNWICKNNNNCNLEKNTFLSGKSNLTANKNYCFIINLRTNHDNNS